MATVTVLRFAIYCKPSFCMLCIATCSCMTCVAMLACQPPAGLLLAGASTILFQGIQRVYVAMAEAPAHVYDCIIMPLGSALATTDLPALGNRGWRRLGKAQIERIQTRDHMVIYISAFGSSLPYKYLEETPDGSKLRYTRKTQHDLIILRSPKATIVSCLCNFQHVFLHTCIHASLYLYMQTYRIEHALGHEHALVKCTMAAVPKVLRLEARLHMKSIYFLLTTMAGREVAGFRWPLNQPLSTASIMDGMTKHVCNALDCSKQCVIKLVASRSSKVYRVQDTLACFMTCWSMVHDDKLLCVYIYIDTVPLVWFYDDEAYETVL